MRYTDEELRDSLRRLADELGKPPTQKQCQSAETTPSARTYHNRFGSWNAALEATGLSINTENPSYTDDELIARLGEFADTCGETPTQRQLEEETSMPSVSAYECHFDSWNLALEEAELPINTESPSYTDDELIARLGEFADTLDETPTTGQLNHKPELPSAKVYEDRFDSWNSALEEAGLEVNRESFTDEQLIAILQEFAAELGHTPTRAELDNRENLPSGETYMRRFGSWNAALRAAGFTPNTEVERYDGTDEELLELLRELAAELGTSPTQDDVDFAPDLPNSGVFAHRFGGWNAAKQQAGLAVRKCQDQYSDAELLQELRRVARRLEKSPTKAEMNDADAPSPSTCQRRFGSWNAAKEEAGLRVTQETPTQ